MELTRQERLRLFLERSRITFRWLGKQMDISGVGVAKLCDGSRISPERHAQLVGLGIPVELLPEPKAVKSGPRKTKKQKSYCKVESNE